MESGNETGNVTAFENNVMLQATHTRVCADILHRQYRQMFADNVFLV
jgi:hypothetical protein